MQLVNEVGQELSTRHKWRRLTFEATISTSATVAYSLPSDLYEIVNDTMWSRTETQQAAGPVGEQEWQLRKAQNFVTEIVPEWRVEYTQASPTLIFLTSPGDGTVYFEYRSLNWIVDTSSSATASLWTADTERPLLDEHLFYSELKWRWLKAKGSDYSVDYQNSQIQVEVARDSDKGGAKKLHYGGRF